MGRIVHFHFFEALNNAFEVQFSGLHFYTLSKTLVACRNMQLRFVLILETMLNNAFNLPWHFRSPGGKA